MIEPTSGVGIEIAGSVIRGVVIGHDVDGHLSSAAEFPINLSNDEAALDAFVLLRAELGEPDAPTRIAMFPPGAMLQRSDVTGRSGPELNELRSTLDLQQSISSTVVIDDGPRRWLLLIRWDDELARLIEDIAERAGFVDATVEPSPMAMARVTDAATSYLRRLVTQGDSHHAVISNRVPVAALAVSTTGRRHPDFDVSSEPTMVERFDQLMSDVDLGGALNHVMSTALRDDIDTARPTIDIAGEAYPSYPAHDLRSTQRQVVALGAAVGAAGLAGPLRPVDTLVATAGGLGDQYDRPWAIEAVSPLPEIPPGDGTGAMRRITRRFRPRRSR